MIPKLVSTLFSSLFFILFPGLREDAEVESAKEVLKKVLEARGGEVKEIKDLKIELDFVEHKEEGDRFEGTLVQFYKCGEPGMTRREIRDCFTGETNVEGYNGKFGWFKSKEKVVLYKGREHYADNKNLKKDIEQFKVFLKVFFLEPFFNEGGTLKVVASTTPLDSKSYVLEGRDEKEVFWRIKVGKKDFSIQKVERQPKGGKREVYEFSGECEFKGIRFPKKIQLTIENKLRFEAGLKSVDINLDLKEKLFQPPQEK